MLLGGSRARGAYLQKSSLPEEPEVYTSILSGGSRARGVYLYAPAPRIECPGWKELEVHTSTLPLLELSVQDGKSSRCIPLRSQEDPELEVYTFRRVRFLKSSRCILLRFQEDPRSRGANLYKSSRCIPSEELPGWKKLEVHTSTLPGGSRARGVYLQKSSLPEELEVHTSTLSGGVYLQKSSQDGKNSRCICLCCRGSDKRTFDTKPDPHACRSKFDDWKMAIQDKLAHNSD